jgi:hypothetical protein
MALMVLGAAANVFGAVAAMCLGLVGTMADTSSREHGIAAAVALGFASIVSVNLVMLLSRNTVRRRSLFAAALLNVALLIFGCHEWFSSFELFGILLPHGDYCQCFHCRQAREATQQSQMPGHPPGCGCFHCQKAKSNPFSPW